MPKIYNYTAVLLLIIILVGCTAPTKTITAKPAPTQTFKQQTELKPDLEVIQKTIIKEVVDISVIGKVKNKGNKDAESVTVKATCTGVGSSTINTGIDLIDVPAGQTKSYSITVLVAPHKIDDCSVTIQY